MAWCSAKGAARRTVVGPGPGAGLAVAGVGGPTANIVIFFYQSPPPGYSVVFVLHLLLYSKILEL